MHIIYLYTHTSFFVTLASKPRAQKSTLIRCQCIPLNCIIVNHRLLYDDSCAGRDDYFGTPLFWLRFQILFVHEAYFMVLPLCGSIQPHALTDFTQNTKVAITVFTIHSNGVLHYDLEPKWLRVWFRFASGWHAHRAFHKARQGKVQSRQMSRSASGLGE